MADFSDDDLALLQNNFMLLVNHYMDFCKKFRFLVKGALLSGEESLSLEIMLDYLDRNEQHLERIRADSNNQITPSKSLEILLGTLLMQNEDYRLLQRIAETRRAGGANWETLQSILNISST